MGSDLSKSQDLLVRSENDSFYNKRVQQKQERLSKHNKKSKLKETQSDSS